MTIFFVAAAVLVPTGEAVIRGGAGASEIVITTTARLAGAIHSVRWGGREFIDSADHGRQLQSASSFGRGGPDFWAECYNPTEAGRRRDGAGPRSSSRLLMLRAAGNELQTVTQMAFWLAPGELSAGRPALNTTVLSNHRVAKRVRIGYKALPQVLDSDVTFTVPKGERHRFAQFEALTGYMPAEFRQFWSFDANSGRLSELSDGPGEQARPVVLATLNGAHAMGVFSPDQPSVGFAGAGYGRFRFVPERVVKWNCVFRTAGEPGEYRYRVFVPIGTREDVRRALIALTAEFGAKR
jgi:hypothetical protein